VGESANPEFGQLLRRVRADARLTQEELAERARLSPRTISDLERGINQTARRDTARLLADALGLTGTARAAFESAAARRGPAPQGGGGPGSAAAARTLPRDVASFTGRGRELAQIRTPPHDPAARAGTGPETGGIYVIGGMAGAGKTAFAVHAAHRLAGEFPDGQFFLPLHAHTPGQQPVDPGHALASLLLASGVAAEQIPAGLEPRMSLWRDRCAGRRLLLLLDDAAGHDQVRPLLPSSPGSLVLITSRRHLTALEDATMVGLETLPEDEAAALLTRLSARSYLDPGEPAVAEIIRLCGRLPLAIGMLARQLQHHPAWTVADLVADLTAARDRLELMYAEDLSVAATFDLSYRDLAAGQQLLFRRLGLHPGASIDAHAAAALTGVSLAQARRGLADLYDNYLLTEPDRGRYQLHDLLREYARSLAATDPDADADAAGARLLDYYLDAAGTAGRFFATRPDRVPPRAGRTPPGLDLSTRDRAGRWLEAEWPNLHAAVLHAAAGDQPARALGLAEAISGFLTYGGHWDQAPAVHRAAVGAARRLGDRGAIAGALTRLGYSLYQHDEYQAGIAALTEAVGLYRDLGDREGLADSLAELGDVQRLARLDAAVVTQTLTEALDLYRALDDGLGEARALTFLGGMHTVLSDYPAAAAELRRAHALSLEHGDRRGQARALNYLSAGQYLTGNYAAATQTVTEVLALYRDLGDRPGMAHALMNLGGIQSATSDYAAAEKTLTQALEAYRELGDRLTQGHAHVYLGSVYTITGQYEAATRHLDQALALYQQVGDPHGEANIYTIRGDVAHRTGDDAEAARLLQQALTLYRERGIPLGEAEALTVLGGVQQGMGDTEAAAATLGQALAIYREIDDRRGQADVLSYLGALERTISGPREAIGHYSEALDLARAVHGRLEEARALEGLGGCLLDTGDEREGLARLRNALELYREIGVPYARRVEAILLEHEPNQDHSGPRPTT
jgi:tetratricopeptide (TPR) repeat protein/transcriptional regulator with XRE-family HTH domain